MIKHRQTTSLWAWLTSTLQQRSFGIVMLFLGLLATIPVGSTVPGLMLAAMAVQLIAGSGEPVFPHFITTRRFADEASPAAWRARGLGHHSISLELTSTGQTIGGGRFGVGALAHLLKNRFYIGEVVYRGEVHGGEQAPIVDRALFAAVQDAMVHFRPEPRQPSAIGNGIKLWSLTYN